LSNQQSNSQQTDEEVKKASRDVRMMTMKKIQSVMVKDWMVMKLIFWMTKVLARHPQKI